MKRRGFLALLASLPVMLRLRPARAAILDYTPGRPVLCEGVEYSIVRVDKEEPVLVIVSCFAPDGRIYFLRGVMFIPKELATRIERRRKRDSVLIVRGANYTGWDLKSLS